MHLQVSGKYCYTRFIPNLIMFFNCVFFLVEMYLQFDVAQFMKRLLTVVL